MMAEEKRNQRIPGYLTATEQELIAMAAALERRDPRSWVRLNAARERIALASTTPLPMPRRMPPSPPTIEVGDDSK